MLTSASLGASCALSGCGFWQSSEKDESAHSVSKVVVCSDGVFDYTLCGYYVARSQGFFKNESIELDEVPAAGGASQLDLVNGAKANVCFSSQDLLAPLYATSNPASIETVATLVQPRNDAEGYQHIVVANDLFLIAREEIALAFLRALELGYCYCHEQTIEAAQAIVAMFPDLDERECSAVLSDMASSFYDANGAWGSIETSIWDARNNALLEQGAIDTPIYTHHGFNLDYLASAERT